MNEKKCQRKTEKLEMKTELVNLEKKTVERKGVFQGKKNRTLQQANFSPQKRGVGKKKDEEMEISKYFEEGEYTAGD